MKKKIIIILFFLGIIVMVIGGIFLFRNIVLKNDNKIEIIDATYSCTKITEKFYEDDSYIYSFPCTKSSSVFVKLQNGNKMLVTKALEENKVTIDELIEAGLDVYKNKK